MSRIKREPTSTVVDRDTFEVTTNGQPSVYSATRDDRSKARMYLSLPLTHASSFLPRLIVILTIFTSHTFRKAIRGTPARPSD